MRRNKLKLNEIDSNEVRSRGNILGNVKGLLQRPINSSAQAQQRRE